MRNKIVLSPSGDPIFAWVEGRKTKSYVIHEGPIFLRHGDKRFGLVHILHRHSIHLERLGHHGEEGVRDYVASILLENTPIYSEELTNWERSKLLALRSAKGMAILEQRSFGNYPVAYSVVSAYPRPRLGRIQVSRIIKK